MTQGRTHHQCRLLCLKYKCQGKHGIRFSLDLILRSNVKASSIHGVQLATHNKIVVRHRWYTSTSYRQHFSILSAAVRQFFSMFCNVTATFPHDRETVGRQFRNSRHSSGLRSVTWDMFRRLYRNLSYATPRIHAERARRQSSAHNLINDPERFPKLVKFYRQPFRKPSGL